jgi:hypothetical protein
MTGVFLGIAGVASDAGGAEHAVWLRIVRQGFNGRPCDGGGRIYR